jgi:diaminopimelate epimerase
VRAEVGDADGIVEVFRSGDNWIEIAIWNPDGSRAEMSGNGTRIAAAWHGGNDVSVRVGTREVRAVRLDGGSFEQDLGEVEVSEPEEVSGLRVVSVDVGNPHAVVEGDPADLPRIGPLLEMHERFPQRTNVQVARRVGRGRIEARVWERGAGETAASGSSAVAVAAAFGFEPATVCFPGGPLEVRFDGRRAFLTGPAERVR